jgi:hypothetical protein
MWNRRSGLLLLFASLATALFFLGYPLYVIRPFRHQGPRELEAALFVLRWQHIVEIVCAAVALIALLQLRRAKPAIAAAFVVIFATLSFVNIFEIMFHPAGAPAFQPVNESKLDKDEKILAVNAHAYPIRVISYHHIVNDTEDGVPIAVTY